MSLFLTEPYLNKKDKTFIVCFLPQILLLISIYFQNNLFDSPIIPSVKLSLFLS